MAITRIKILVDQVTEQVIWLSYFLDTKPPVIESNLNFFTYSGEPTVNVWQLYLSYKLHYNIKDKVFYKKLPNSNSFKQIQFTRAKCIAVNYISSACDYQYEKYNYINHQLYLDQNSFNHERWVELMMHTHSCTKDEAKKLLQFKREEYELAVFHFESIRYTFANKIKQAQTLEEVNDYYKETIAKLISPNSAKLINSPIIQGVGLESGQNSAP